MASNDLRAFVQWTDVLERSREETPVISRCERDSTACSSLRLVAWRSKIATLAPQSPETQLWEINRFVNDLVPGACGLPEPGESWPTPVTVVQSGRGALAGAILKYASLRDVGWPAARLRIAVVTDVLRNCLTAVVLAETDDGSRLLDDRALAVRETNRVGHFIAHYSFNESTRWIHLTPRQEAIP